MSVPRHPIIPYYPNYATQYNPTIENHVSLPPSHYHTTVLTNDQQQAKSVTQTTNRLDSRRPVGLCAKEKAIGGSRTLNPRITNAVLYRLSYVGNIPLTSETLTFYAPSPKYTSRVFRPKPNAKSSGGEMFPP